MSMDKVGIDAMASAIMGNLTKYAELATDDMKKAVNNAGSTTKKEIQANAPENTGAYKRSWTITKESENSNSLALVVHSKNRYQLTHLLEHGHAKRNGGRVAGHSHIAPAEEKAEKQLLKDIEEALKK